MKLVKSWTKLLLVGLVLCCGLGSLSGVDRPWHPGETYTIPDDGFTYTLDWSFSLTDDLLISGTLKILALTGNDVVLTNDGHTITIESDGILTLTAGWGTDGADASGSPGADGVDGKNVFLENNGTILVDGILTLTGGAGGAGGAGDPTGINKDGGAGGAAGSANLIGSGSVAVSDGGTINVLGGVGGLGGDGGGDESNDGGAGGGGGAATISVSVTITVVSGGTLSLVGGSGGTGGAGGTNGSDNVGGDGGSGGEATISAFTIITITTGGSLALHGGAGGTGGVGGTSISAPGNDGGAGGAGGGATISASLIVSGGTLNLSGGNGGDGGEKVGIGGEGGAGGDGGTPSFSEAAEKIFSVPIAVVVVVTINFTDGADGSGAAGGAGGVARGLVNEVSAQLAPPQPLYDPNLTLSQQLDIDFTWTITQNQNVWGNGNRIVLGPNGEIVIDGGVMFLLDNLEIEGIDDNKIRCIEDDSILKLSNVTWNQDANYTFTKGEIKICGECTIDGAGTIFTLKDITKPLTIKSNATLKMMPDTTLEYDTSPSNLLVMVDGTSTLHLNNTRLLATQSLVLQTGVLSTQGLGILEGNPGTISIGGLSNIIVLGGFAKVGNVVW